MTTTPVEMTLDFAEPFTTRGSAVVSPLPPDRVAIDTRQYVIDTSGEDQNQLYRREGVEVVQQRNTTSNRDLLLLPQNVWRWQDESWHAGAGQKHVDRDDSMPFRFSRSFGIDVWTKYQLSLLNETKRILTLTTTDKCFLQPHRDYLVAVVGNTSWWWTDPDIAPVEHVFGPVTCKAISITYDGVDVWVLCDDGMVYRLTNPTTSAAATIPTPPDADNALVDATFIAYVKGYLIAGVGNELWDITGWNATPTPASVLVYTSPVVGFEWVGAAEGTNAIYLAGGAGDKYVIHRIAVSDDGSHLMSAITAATLPDGERALSIGAYLGYVFVGSDIGARMATPSSAAGDLVLGALLRTGAPIYAFEGQGQYVWATSNHIDPVPDTGPVTGLPTQEMCGLSRADLQTFTVTASTPAYAADIVAPNEHGKDTRSVVTWRNKRAFSVDNGGVYIETDNKMPAGWLAPGRVNFSVEDIKTGLYCQVKWEPLDGTVAIDLSYDNEPPVRALNWSLPDTISSGNVSLNGAQFSRVEPLYVLYRDSTDITKGPIFNRFELRARPAKGKAARWYLPLVISEMIDLNGNIEPRDPTKEVDLLLGLVESGKMFALQEAGHTYQAVAIDYKWLPQKLTEQGSGWEGLFLLICEEVR